MDSNNEGIEQANNSFSQGKRVGFLVVLVIILVGAVLYWQKQGQKPAQQNSPNSTTEQGYPFTVGEILKAESDLNSVEKISISKTLAHSQVQVASLPEDLKAFVLPGAVDTGVFNVTYTTSGSGYIISFRLKDSTVEQTAKLFSEKLPKDWQALSSNPSKYLTGFEVENTQHKVKVHILHEQGGAQVKIFVVNK